MPIDNRTNRPAVSPRPQTTTGTGETAATPSAATAQDAAATAAPASPSATLENAGATPQAAGLSNRPVGQGGQPNLGSSPLGVALGINTPPARAHKVGMPTVPAAPVPASVRDKVIQLSADPNKSVLNHEAIKWMTGPDAPAVNNDAAAFLGRVKIEPGDLLVGALKVQAGALQKKVEAGVASPEETQKLQALGAQIQQLSSQTDALKALNENGPIHTTPRQQMLMPDGSVTTRVIIGGGVVSGGWQANNGVTWRADLMNIADVVNAYDREGVRVNRSMVSLDESGPAATVGETVQGDRRSAGMGHQGSYPAAKMMIPDAQNPGKFLRDANGDYIIENAFAGNDFPVGYGWTLSSSRYTGVLTGVDYDRGTKKDIPLDVKRQYVNNADTWAIFQLPVVSFSSADVVADETDYHFNTLDVADRGSLGKLAGFVMVGDPKAVTKNYGTNYCAEGQWNIDNLGPNVLITTKGLMVADDAGNIKPLKFDYTDANGAKSSIEATGDAWTSSPMYKIAEAVTRHAGLVAKAEGERKGLSGQALRDWAAEHVEDFAMVGWQKAREELQQGQAPDPFFAAIFRTNHHGVLPRFADQGLPGGEAVWGADAFEVKAEPWQKYQPKHPKGLVAEPISVPKLAQELITNEMNREQIAEVLVKHFATPAANDEEKAARKALLGAMGLPVADDGSIPAQALPELAGGMAYSLQAGLLLNEEFIDGLKQQAGYHRIVDPDPSNPAEAHLAGKKDFDALVEKMTMAALNPEFNSEQRQAAINSIEQEFKALKFKIKRERREPDGTTAESVTVEGSMQFRPPNAPVASSRFPGLVDGLEGGGAYVHIAYTLPEQWFSKIPEGQSNAELSEHERALHNQPTPPTN